MSVDSETGGGDRRRGRENARRGATGAARIFAGVKNINRWSLREALSKFFLENFSIFYSGMFFVSLDFNIK